MATRRVSLRYFSGADLEPSPGPHRSTDRGPQLLESTEIAELSHLAEDFARDKKATRSWPWLKDRPHIRTFMTMCAALGAVRIRSHADGMVMDETGRLSRHVPKILSLYLENSWTMFDGWDQTRHVQDEQMCALEMIHTIELSRIEQSRREGCFPEPLAARPVAFAIFHALNERDEHCYLFEVNKDWDRLNFIGGKQEPEDDGDYRETARREIKEELGISPNRVRLTPLHADPIEAYGLSGNAGSLASYPCVLFGVRVEGRITTRPRDRWITEADFRKCDEADESPLLINPLYLDFLLRGSPSVLETVPLSTTDRVRSQDVSDLLPERKALVGRWAGVLREHKDLAAGVLTLAGAVLTLAATLVTVIITT